jgi:hypothetical protein
MTCRPYWQVVDEQHWRRPATTGGLPTPCASSAYLTTGLVALQAAVDGAIAAARGATGGLGLGGRLLPLPRPAFDSNFATGCVII